MRNFNIFALLEETTSEPTVIRKDLPFVIIKAADGHNFAIEED